MPKFFKGFIFTLICLIPIGRCLAQKTALITLGELGKQAEYPASRKLAGRYPGTAGDMAAAIYILEPLKAIGLSP